MKFKLLAAFFVNVAGAQVHAQMPTSFNFSSQINTDQKETKAYGAPDCLQSAKTLSPSVELQTQLATGLGCSAYDPKTPGLGKYNATCTSIVVDGGQTILGGIYSLDDGSFAVWDQEYPRLSANPKGRVWYKLIFGKKGTQSGVFEIRGIDKNEWDLSQVAGTSILQMPTDCKLDFSTQNTFQ